MISCQICCQLLLYQQRNTGRPIALMILSTDGIRYMLVLAATKASVFAMLPKIPMYTWLGSYMFSAVYLSTDTLDVMSKRISSSGLLRSKNFSLSNSETDSDSLKPASFPKANDSSLMASRLSALRRISLAEAPYLKRDSLASRSSFSSCATCSLRELSQHLCLLYSSGSSSLSLLDSLRLVGAAGGAGEDSASTSTSGVASIFTATGVSIVIASAVLSQRCSSDMISVVSSVRLWSTFIPFFLQTRPTFFPNATNKPQGGIVLHFKTFYYFILLMDGYSLFVV
ncbi:hypothetical protein [Cyprinid herpesvirus 2]|nr:hypothetical protein [Cyprinid herpesvirus 2]